MAKLQQMSLNRGQVHGVEQPQFVNVIIMHFALALTVFEIFTIQIGRRGVT